MHYEDTPMGKVIVDFSANEKSVLGHYNDALRYALGNFNKPNMKPFNLQAALNGAKLVTRNGEEVTGFRKRVAKGELGFDYEADFRGIATTYRANGQFATEPTRKDLFMVEEKPALIPFNHVAALNGAKVVTRDGREVKELRRNPYKLNATIEGLDYNFTADGNANENKHPHALDLFMAPPEPAEYETLVAKIEALIKDMHESRVNGTYQIERGDFGKKVTLVIAL